MTNLLDTPDVPDDAARHAKAEVEKLTELVRRYPDDVYYALCLRGWLAALAKEEQSNA